MSAKDIEFAVTWRVHALLQLHWRRWGDEWAVFDVGSGQTHRMDTLTAVSLMLLEIGPMATRQIALRLVDELGMEEDQALFDALEDLLERLSIAGLIEAA